MVKYGKDVLAIDYDINTVQKLSTELPHVMQMDATNIDALRQAGVELRHGAGLHRHGF